MTNTDTVPDLASWLLEQIAEDERLAQVAHGYLVEHADAFRDYDEPPSDWRESWRGFGRSARSEPSGLPVSSHIAAWHPARVLAECDAKRRIVAEYTETSVTYDELATMEAVLSLMALPYSGRPGYREEWRL